MQKIEPVGACSRRALFPNYSRLKPDNAVRKYRVDMRVDYEPGDHPVVFRVSSAGEALRPWQAYASYALTGGLVLYGYCAEGFAVGKVFGTPQAKPSQFDGDMAAFDPESAAASGVTDLRLGWTCVRSR